MKLKDILSPSFKDFRKPHKPIVVVAYDSDCCQEVVARQWLTETQMRRAAERYRLGKSKSGKTIFWMIDEIGLVRDGRIGEAWVSQMLMQRHPDLLSGIPTEHCFLGMHLLAMETGAKVCLVESERSAVVLSELYPAYVWLAWVYTSNLTIEKFEPLKGHRVVVYPRASEAKEDFTFCCEIASLARQIYHLDITVSDVLETQASPSQKAKRIDLVDFLFEGSALEGQSFYRPTNLPSQEGFEPLSKSLANRWQET